MKLKLDENFIERMAQLENYEQLYAALWIVSGIEHIKYRINGDYIMRLSKFGNYPTHCIDIYKLGYVQALIDLKQPLVFKNILGSSQECIGKGFDALGINIFN